MYNNCGQIYPRKKNSIRSEMVHIINLYTKPSSKQCHNYRHETTPAFGPFLKPNSCGSPQ